MPESRLLPVSGTIRMPPGITVADVTVTYLGVLRGGGLVSGGTLKAQAGADGVPKVNGGPLQLHVAFAGDFVERHPYARFGVSYRGAARGYEFDVDLALPPDATAVDLTRTVGGLELVSPEQLASVQQITAGFDAATLDLTVERKKVEQAVADTAQSEADARVAAGEARATGAEVQERFSGLRWRAYDAEQMYVDGNRVLLALVDAGDQPLMYWDTLGICHLPAGLDIPNAPEKPVDLPQLSSILASGLVNSLSTRQAIKTPGLTLSAGWQYANGEEVAPLLTDKAGALLWLLRRSGVLDAPGGLSTAGVATTRQSGGYADGAEVLDVLRADMQGNLMAFFDTTGALHVPGGIVAPGSSDNGLGGLLLVSASDLWCVGDSMTEGAGSTDAGGGPYGRRLAKLLGRNYRIDGLGGNTSRHIAGRIGATRVMLTADVTIPADGSRVAVSISNPILRGSGNRTLSVTVGDVAMVLSHENHNPDGSVTEASQNSPHYLQRAAAGAAVPLTAGTAVLPVVPASAPQSTTIIWAGRNNPYDIGDIVQDVRATVNLLREHVVSPRYIVLPVMPSTSGSINDSPLSDAREALRREHGERFFDGHVPLLTDAQGRLRSEYAISDGLHWNDAGYSILASQLASYLRWKWW